MRKAISAAHPCPPEPFSGFRLVEYSTDVVDQEALNEIREGISNQMIDKILDQVIYSLSRTNRDTFSHVCQNKKIEIVLRNVLHSQKDQIASTLK
jgi:hypothetical protein